MRYVTFRALVRHTSGMNIDFANSLAILPQKGDHPEPEACKPLIYFGITVTFGSEKFMSW